MRTTSQCIYSFPFFLSPLSFSVFLRALEAVELLNFFSVGTTIGAPTPPKDLPVINSGFSEESVYKEQNNDRNDNVVKKERKKE
jgi:hypothetical protein